MMFWKSFAIYFGLYFMSIQPSLQPCHAFDLQEGRNFIFIRHGQTPWGPEDILKGPQDLELNPVGRRQAEEASQFVRNSISISNPIVYSSTLRRAYQTAEILAEKFSPCPYINLHEGLKERYYGDYSKATPQSLSTYIPPDAEPTNTFQNRVRKTLTEIFKQAPLDNSDLIIISHQKVFEYLTEWLTQEKLKLNQGGVCYFKFDQGKYSVQIYECSN